jgi:hypothetical protein
MNMNVRVALRDNRAAANDPDGGQTQKSGGAPRAVRRNARGERDEGRDAVHDALHKPMQHTADAALS